MKTIEQILKQEPVYLNDWTHKIDVVADFEDIYVFQSAPYVGEVSEWGNEDLEMALKAYEDVNILFASYGEDRYSGDAWVLFENGGQLYEVNGSHCSCFGLEGQWDEEEVSLAELEHRLVHGRLGEDRWSENDFKSELCDFLGVEYKSNSYRGL